MFEDLLAAAFVVFNWKTIAAISAGTVAGLMIGAIPGLSATMGMALLSPFTFFVGPLIGIPFLIGLFKGGTFGGSISAILIGTPGTAANAATLLDGYEMRKQGKAGSAIMGALNASLIGDAFGTVALIFGAPALALIAIQFGPHEFFALVLFSLTMICYVSGRSLAKGVLAASMGVFFALIGTDPIGGTPRLTFGLRELAGGLNVIALVTGLFGITEVLIQMESFGRSRMSVSSSVNLHLAGAGMQFRSVVKHLWTIVRSSLVGTFIGALPGIGSETSPWVAYGLAKRASKEPEKFGRGAYEGVVAPEAANNAVCAAAMIPMLVFGIPGDIVTAILMSALIAQGLQPGPFLISEHRDVIFGLFMSVLFATVALYVFGRLTMRWWIRIMTIPRPLLYSIVVAFCVVGTYSVKSSSFDLAVMLAFGIIGYVLRKLDIAIAPMLLSFVLAKILEESLRRGLVQSDGSILAFFERPITAAILSLTVLVLIAFAVLEWRRRRAGGTREGTG
ncbi:MAG: tripartite tricarboxylate transporter permease [Paracoccaceae bacterium]|nr:tripartite tricarboxylate transporter permease [Paracoccaceae bacterium]MDE2913492.1 tripartite tricarboxylate transporter permease [Paracoccaceae bacterium]